MSAEISKKRGRAKKVAPEEVIIITDETPRKTSVKKTKAKQTAEETGKANGKAKGKARLAPAVKSTSPSLLREDAGLKTEVPSEHPTTTSSISTTRKAAKKNGEIESTVRGRKPTSDSSMTSPILLQADAFERTKTTGNVNTESKILEAPSSNPVDQIVDTENRSLSLEQAASTVPPKNSTFVERLDAAEITSGQSSVSVEPPQTPSVGVQAGLPTTKVEENPKIPESGNQLGRQEFPSRLAGSTTLQSTEIHPTTSSAIPNTSSEMSLPSSDTPSTPTHNPAPPPSNPTPTTVPVSPNEPVPLNPPSWVPDSPATSPPSSNPSSASSLRPPTRQALPSKISRPPSAPRPTELPYDKVKKDPRFKALSRKYTSLMVAIPIALVTSVVLYDRYMNSTAAKQRIPPNVTGIEWKPPQQIDEPSKS